jgi:oligopeptide transport system substrate-binding protein
MNGFCRSWRSRSCGPAASPAAPFARRGLCFFAALCIAALLAGCSGGSHEPAAPPNVLHYALTVEPGSFDPAKAQDIYTSEMLINVFEGLVRYDDQNRIVPVLAERWEVSADGKTYTFHLRQGVNFHNGQPVTAEDVKYSWERALWPRTKSNTAANYLDGVVGMKEVVSGEEKTLKGVRIDDPYRFEVTLDHPRACFLGMLSYPSNFIVCKMDVQPNRGQVDDTHCVGTGPFKVESYRPNNRVTLMRNEAYWAGKAKIERIEDMIQVDPHTAYSNFETNKLDFINDVPFTQYAQDAAAGKLTAQYHKLPYANMLYLVMDSRKNPIFGNALVRKAFAYGIDRQEILKLAYKGLGTIATGILPPELPMAGSPPPAIPYDPSKARAMLSRAGYPGGRGFPTLTLCYVQSIPSNEATAEIVRENLKKNLGITVNLQAREATAFFNDQYRDAMEFYYTGWVADYPDPQDFTSTLFGSHASLNHTGYASSQFDALCDRADRERSPGKRAALYGQANRAFMQDVGVLPVVFAPRIALVKPIVQGWQMNLCNMLPFNTVSIAGAQTEK